MHELGIVLHVIDTLEKLAEEEKLTQIVSVTLEIGEVSGVLHQEFMPCWKWAVKKTKYMQGAELRIETIPAVTYCEACASTYETVAHGKTCPHCGSGQTYLLQGNETNIKEIEAY